MPRLTPGLLLLDDAGLLDLRRRQRDLDAVVVVRRVARHRPHRSYCGLRGIGTLFGTVVSRRTFFPLRPVVLRLPVVWRLALCLRLPLAVLTRLLLHDHAVRRRRWHVVRLRVA